jgi:hypothetical protein
LTRRAEDESEVEDIVIHDLSSAAKRAKVGEAVIRRWIREGLPAAPVGRRGRRDYRLFDSWLIRYMEARAAQGGPVRVRPGAEAGGPAGPRGRRPAERTRLLSVAEAARLAKATEDDIRRWIGEGLQAMPVGRAGQRGTRDYEIYDVWLWEFLEARAAGGPAPAPPRATAGPAPPEGRRGDRRPTPPAVRRNSFDLAALRRRLEEGR